MPGPDPLADVPPEDLAWCHEAVQDVSRTFALTVDVLEEPMDSYICLGYLLCRVADTVEDASHIPPAEQAALLRTYDAVLDSTDETDAEQFAAEVTEWLPAEGERDADWAVVASAPRIVATFEALPRDVREAITPPVREMVDGMADFVERYADDGGLRIDDQRELEEYCYYAAGTVGNLITNLVTRGEIDAEREQTLYETAEEFGLLLQLVNVSKDVYDDYNEENNVYLPAEWMAEEGLEQDEVLDPEKREGATSVVRRTTDLARSYLDDAGTYLQHVPLRDGNTLEAWAVPFLLAVGTLREVREHPEDVLTESGVKVSRKEVFAVVSAMSSKGRDALPSFRERIASAPFHQQPTSAD
ncbi:MULTISPECIES: phytoene/squalene synthase family protein [Halolamina]|uniref:Farnesyl-diphosphate farnesyltransferase n=1 Tax=Halolamina pelagica TaxID=699431 RepID=A0A1I5MHS8_9EURY|nr:MULTISPECIES: phytoene/squalene synthase family protein [Halolamina]NHX36034.1 squalene/phytoene synthase family protein [Halolamina sp. R1-12]SFP09152.1 farnesyl-diphosphate farnesyltransferase [Halolamina pelagica]